ncbi:MAG: hypothetical protein FWD40_01960 [Treponema sp.]|nr:hypothetical protein [Treponema sp.]
MIRKSLIFILIAAAILETLCAQGTEPGVYQYVLRGEVFIDLEPIYAGHVDEEYPLDIPRARERALEEAVLYFAAMLYGWSFKYQVGERARQIDEVIELELLGSIQTNDPALHITDMEVSDMRLRVWTDYDLTNRLAQRMQVWRSGTIRNAQGLGYSPSYLEVYPGWIAVKQMALEDAARIALRTMLRGSERNRPREVTGFLSLASFPRFFIDAGRWAVSARFRVQVTEIIPFAVY